MLNLKPKLSLLYLSYKIILELTKAIDQSKDVSNVKGIAYESNGQVVQTERRERIQDLDSLGYPSRDGLDIEKNMQRVLSPPLPLSKQVSARVSTSRGCRFNCDFCSTDNVFPGSRTERTPESVVEELEYLNEEYGVNLVAFGDEDFFGNPQRVREIFDLIEGKGLDEKMYFRSFIRANDVEPNEDLLREINNRDYVGAILGIEALDDEALDGVHKGTNVRMIERALGTLDNIGIITRATYMIGYPNQTEEKMREGLERLKQLPVDEVYLPIFTPLPGTRTYEDFKDIINDRTWDHYDTNHPVMDIPVDNILEKRRQFLEEFYSEKRFWKRFDKKTEGMAPEEKKKWKETYREFFEAGVA